MKKGKRGAYRRVRRAARAVGSALELPPDVLGTTPLLRVYGTEKVVVEGHTGVLECTGACLRVYAPHCEVRVCGTGFVLEEIEEGLLVLSGAVCSVEMLARKGGGL